MRIEKLQLHNIATFDDLNIEFKEKTDSDKAEVHIFTGENGCGKSTILYALAGGFIKEQDIYQRFRSKEENPNVTVFFENNNIINYRLDPSSDKFKLKKTILYSMLNTGHLSFFASNGQKNKIFDYYQACQNFLQNNFNFISLSYSGNRSIKTGKIGIIKEIFESPFTNALSFTNSINTDLINQWIANTKAKYAWAKVYNNQKKVNKFKSAIESIEKIVSEITNMEIEFVFEYDPIQVLIKINEEILEFDVLPDGLKSILSWVADLLIRIDRIKWKDETSAFDKNFILFLDEIDIHLHIAWQRKILPIIQKYFKNAQIFVSTHSPFVVGSVEGAYVYNFELKDSKSYLEKVSESRAGNSFELIIDEVFNIKERFDIETESNLEKFYAMRQALLGKKNIDEDKFLKLIKKLKTKSSELADIIGLELIQIKKITKKDYYNV